MKHRTLFSLAAAAIVALSMGTAAPKPAEAGIHIYLGAGGHHNCRWRRVHVKVWSRYYHRWIWVWQKRRVCW
jgi:hypothetical protein